MPARRLPGKERTQRMSAENEAYREGTRLLRALTALREEVVRIDASDTQCRERAVQRLDQARERLREALSALAELV